MLCLQICSILGCSLGRWSGSSIICNLLESPVKSRANKEQNQKPRKMIKLGDNISPRYSGAFDGCQNRKTRPNSTEVFTGKLGVLVWEEQLKVEIFFADSKSNEYKWPMTKLRGSRALSPVSVNSGANWPGLKILNLNFICKDLFFPVSGIMTWAYLFGVGGHHSTLCSHWDDRRQKQDLDFLLQWSS